MREHSFSLRSDPYRFQWAGSPRRAADSVSTFQSYSKSTLQCHLPRTPGFDRCAPAVGLSSPKLLPAWQCSHRSPGRDWGPPEMCSEFWRCPPSRSFDCQSQSTASSRLLPGPAPSWPRLGGAVACPPAWLSRNLAEWWNFWKCPGRILLVVLAGTPRELFSYTRYTGNRRDAERGRIRWSRYSRWKTMADFLDKEKNWRGSSNSSITTSINQSIEHSINQSVEHSIKLSTTLQSRLYHVTRKPLIRWCFITGPKLDNALQRISRWAMWAHFGWVTIPQASVHIK